MEERNCYLVVEYSINSRVVHESFVQKKIISNIDNCIFKASNRRLTPEQTRSMEKSFSENYETIELTMIQLTEQEAKDTIKYLAEQEKYITAKIKYHAIEIPTVTNSVPTITVNPKDITSNLDKMKQYLKDIYTLEKQAYCSKRAKDEIVNIVNSLGIEQEIEKPKTDEENIFTILLYVGMCGVGGAAVGFVISWILASVFDSFIPVFIGAVAGAIFGIFQLKTKHDLDKATLNHYEQKVKKDRKRVNEELESISAYRENERLYALNISLCQDALNQLYSLDIIFPKYRNFVAISQIYEYFMSGRCTELEGHEGAYNIFESELRQNVIISQLNDVLANLEEIKQTQYMIYDAICFANSQLAQIESNTAAIAYNTSVTAENTAIIARYRNVR